MASRRTIAVVAIAKDEDPYLLEWLAYHLALGVDHIVLYDNGSRVPIASQISTLGAWGFVSVRQWRDVAGKDSQLEAYAHYLRNYRRRFEWTAAIDLDEFICLPQHETIQNFLAGFDHANGIVINWRYFGSSGQTHHKPGRLTERFTRAAQLHNGINTGVKAIYRTAEIERLIHHWSPLLTPRRVCSADGTLVPNETHTVLPIKESNFACAQINHYFVKSREEWDRKARRGYSWVEEDRGLDRFKLCDTNDVEDTSMLRLGPGMDRWVARLERPTAPMPWMLDRVAGAVPTGWRF